MAPRAQKRKITTPSGATASKKRELGLPSDPEVSLPVEARAGMPNGIGGYIQQRVFKEAGFRAQSRSSDGDDFIVSSDSEASILSEPSGRNRGGRNRKQQPKEDEDEAYVGRSDSDSEVEEFNIPKSEKSTFEFDYSIEKARRWSGVVNLPQGVWSEGERDLFFRLAMRGFEPLIPKHWHLDFPTLPDSLFAEIGSDHDPVIHAIKSEFHGGLSEIRQQHIFFSFVLG